MKELTTAGVAGKLWEETDSRPRRATVYLHTMKLSQSAQSSGICVDGPDHTPFKHWGVAIDFNDRGVIYELGYYYDEAGKKYIKPTWSTFDFSKKEGSLQKVGEIERSPAYVRNLAAVVSSNYQQYKTFTINCQHWANELIEKLGLQPLNFETAGQSAAKIGLVSMLGVAAGGMLAYMMGSQTEEEEEEEEERNEDCQAQKA